MSHQDKTLSPELISQSYIRYYQAFHGRDPIVRHMGGFWYQVNGEIVHRTTMINEAARLRAAVKEQQKNMEKGLIHRLIARLKAI